MQGEWRDRSRSYQPITVTESPDCGVLELGFRFTNSTSSVVALERTMIAKSLFVVVVE